MGHSHDDHLRLVARLRETAADVGRLTAGLGGEALARRVEEGKWSLKEIVCHLGRVQEVFAGRIEAMLAEDGAALASYDPEGDAEFDRLAALPGEQTLAAFREARARLLDRLSALQPPEWHRSGRHPEYPRYDVHFAVEYLLHHEGHHLYQMFQRRAKLAGRLP